MVALASLLNPKLFADTFRRSGGLARSSAFRAQGEACHLSPSVRRAFADRSVRLQTETGRSRRHRTARLGSAGAAHYRHDVGPEFAAGRAFDFQVRARRRERNLDQRTAAAHRQNRRRHHASSRPSIPTRSITIRRLLSSKPALCSRAARAWARGSAMGSAAKIRIFPRSSC